MANKVNRKKRPSLLWSLADRLTAIIYSFFVNGRVGDMLSSHDTLCKKSFLAKTVARKRLLNSNALMKYPESVMEKSVASRSLTFLRGFWAGLKLNVYGMFFVFYGLAACIVYLIPVFMNGLVLTNEMPLIISGIITVCALPLLFSGQSVIEAISSSRLVSRFVLNILCVPEEQLRVKKKYGGTGYVFVSAIIAMILGALSIFSHPLFVPVVLICLLILLAIFSFPEIGIIATLAMLPFIKYLPGSEIILLTLVLVTGMSYFFKVMQRKRTFSLSPEITMVLLFCGFVLVAGMFSYGGAETFWNSLVAVLLITGGFILTYNLINSERLLNACLKTITVSVLILCLIGIWESVYNGISMRIIDRISPDISSITENNLLYILDNGMVFGMLAVFVFPILFAYVAKRKSVKGAVAICSLGVILLSAAWMCSHYEIMVALIIEIAMFWLLFSHKTMTAVIFAAIPIGIVAILYPYGVKYLGLPNISEILMEYVPASIAGSERHISVAEDVMRMLKDGNMLGIGVGENAFKMAFPPYASDASSGASSPMSFILQLMCWGGVFGSAAFAIFTVFLTKRSLGFFISAERGEIRSKALALFCGLAAALLLGGVYGIWEDIKVMYLFWVMVGLLMGYIRLGNANAEIQKTEYMNASDAADVEVVFYD